MKLSPLYRLFLLQGMIMAPCLAADHSWNFSDSNDRFRNTELGGEASATLDYYDPNGTGWGPVATAFGTASFFGLPSLPGGEAEVMAFPACSFEQGYTLNHGGSPNGVFVDEGWISNYTLIVDVLYPSGSEGKFRALYQTASDNSDDAEIYFGTENGVGISTRYTGLIKPDTWHRVVIVVRSAPGEGQLHKYIDGTFVGGQGTTGAAIGERWSLNGALQLLTDDGGETAPGYVSSIRFIDRNLTMNEAMALGQATAAGTQVAGPAAAPFPYELPREVDIIAHRGESCCAPENTLLALALAYDEGADYCEVDIRMSGDGVAVLMHDATVDRTTDGSGAVTDYTAAQLASRDAGSWFSDAFSGESVPTLEEAYVLATGKGGKLYLDLKVTGMEGAIKRALDGAGVAVEDTWMWVYNNATTAAALRNLMPGAKIIWGEPGTGWQTNPNYWDEMRAMGVFGYDLNAGNGNIDAEFALTARAEGFYISNYTLLDPDALINSVGHGAMGLETDFVAITKMMMPPYDIIFTVSPDIDAGTELGASHLNATAAIAGTFSYDPPAGTVLPAGTSILSATFNPDDQATYPVRTVTVPIFVDGGPVDFSTDKEVYDYEEDIIVTWENGPANASDWIGIYAPGAVPGGDLASTIWNYTNNTRTADVGSASGTVTFFAPPLPPGEWNLFFLEDDGYGALAGPNTITVQGSDLEAFWSDSMTFEAEGSMILRWVVNPNGLVIESLEVSDGFTVTDVLGRTSLTLPAPNEATTYTLTLNGGVRAGTTVFPSNPAGGLLSIPANALLPGENLEVSFSGGQGNASDWIGIYQAGIIPSGDPASSRFLYVDGNTEGTVIFDLAGNQLPEGEYAIFFFVNDGYERIADPLRLTIGTAPVVPTALEITAFERDENGGDFVWSAVAGQVYEVRISTDLVSWEVVSNPVRADADEMSLRIPATLLPDDGTLFLRVQVAQ
ncbi:MAG: hypothetical protein ACJAVK_002261 [Akkermansiaceae bacterium]|jgi:hypothetical protein